MQDFIQMATAKLGGDESSIKSATGGLLGMIGKQLGEGDFKQLLDKFPGADALLAGPAADAASPGSEGGGLLSGVVGSLSSALGGKLGGLLGGASALKDSGLSADKIGPFVETFIGYVREKGGSGLVDKVLGKVAELAKLLG